MSTLFSCLKNGEYYNITETLPFLHDVWSFFDWHPMLNKAPVISSAPPFSASFAMPEMLIKSLVTFVCSLITVLTLPYPLIQPFFTHRAKPCIMTDHANYFRAPLLFDQSFCSLLFNRCRERNLLRLVAVPLCSFTLGTFRSVFPSRFPAPGRIPAYFPANRGGMNSNFLSNHFLFHSCPKKGLNLISLYQSELCVIF